MTEILGFDSAFLRTLGEQGPQRLKTQNLSQVLSEVAHSYTKTLPAGCSLNSRAQFSDIDKALEYARRREKTLDDYVKSELKKINSPPKRTRPEIPGVIHRRFHSHFKDKISSKEESPLPILRTRSPSPIPENYPQRFKSKPMHRDPKFAFKKPNLNALKPFDYRNKRMQTLEGVNIQCSSFDSGSKKEKDKIDGTLAICKDIDWDMHSWAHDVARISKIAKDEKESTVLINTRRANHAIDLRVFNLCKGKLREDMQLMTHQLLQMGPTKLWKHNHKAYAAYIDAAIASVADKKS